MTIELPQYLSDCERLEYIKIIHKMETCMKKTTGAYSEGYQDCLKHIEMFLSGAIKRVQYGKDN